MESFRNFFKKISKKIRGPPGPQGEQGPQGPQGLKGEDCEDYTNLPPSPAYPFPECSTCEIVKGKTVCSNVENNDKFYILGVRNDNSSYWKQIEL